MPNLGAKFYQKLVKVCSELNMAPDQILNVMVLESGLNPSAHNKNGNASGLVQFMPDTLHGLGFKGSDASFRELSAEKQLDYVKKLVQTGMQFNGGPFKSAAQYYVYNFWPVGLKLKDVKSGNPDAPIVEKNPEYVVKNGTKYSKKYLEVGYKISISMEHGAYVANPGLDINKDGRITYGDLQAVLNRTAKQDVYKQALQEMQASTGYNPSSIKHKPMLSDNTHGQHGNILDELIQRIASDNSKLYKKYLPINSITIKIASNSIINNIEFARILCLALDENLQSKSFTHSNYSQTEVECNINSDLDLSLKTITQLSGVVANEFDNTIRIECVEGKSYLPTINLKFALNNYKQFMFKRTHA
jgi:hypothetical protein